MCHRASSECTFVIYITFLRSQPLQNMVRSIIMAPESSHSSTSNVWNKNPSSTLSSPDLNQTSSTFSEFPTITKHISSSSKNEVSSNASRSSSNITSSGSNISRSGSNLEKRQPEIAAAKTLSGSAPSGSNQVIQRGSE